jgi:hypothetical protein
MLIARSTNAESTNSGCNDLSVVMSYFWVLLLLSSFNFLGATITIKQSPKHCAAFYYYQCRYFTIMDSFQVNTKSPFTSISFLEPYVLCK